VIEDAAAEPNDDDEPDATVGELDEGDLDATDEPDATVETELEDGQLAYDCTAWAGESRGLLTSLLTTAGIAHAWQGTTLTVREDDEAAVDDLIDEVLVAARPALDPSVPKLVYEVGQWPVSLQTELADALTAADIAYEWDEAGDLVVREEDEDAVAAVLEELPDPDEGEISADDGVAVHELFDSLFMAADKLAKHPADPGATVSLVDDAEVIARVALPFGFEPSQWRRLVGEVAGLRVAIEGDTGNADLDDPDPDPDEDGGGDEDGGADEGPVGPASDERIAELARELRDHLRQYV
jgi:hypothetical protein